MKTECKGQSVKISRVQGATWTRSKWYTQRRRRDVSHTSQVTSSSRSSFSWTQIIPQCARYVVHQSLSLRRLQLTDSLLESRLLFFIFLTPSLTYCDLSASSSGTSPGGTQWEFSWKPWANLPVVPIFVYQYQRRANPEYYCSQSAQHPPSYRNRIFFCFNSISKSFCFLFSLVYKHTLAS